VKIGQYIKTVNANSGKVEFLRVTKIYGRRFFARKIPESEVNQNLASIVVRAGTYGLQEKPA